MPLVPGKSQKAIRQNIEIEEKIGKRKPKQAVAIALNEAAKSGYKPKSKAKVKSKAKAKKKSTGRAVSGDNFVAVDEKFNKKAKLKVANRMRTAGLASNLKKAQSKMGPSKRPRVKPQVKGM